MLSPLFAYEGLTAFFLEAAFLGVLLFGRTRVPPWAYFVSALMVAIGTLFSSFWIFWQPTAGCRRRPVTRSSTANSLPRGLVPR